MPEVRLIDANVLKNSFDSAYTTFGQCVYAKGIVDRQPTIEAEPVRHGRWIEKPPYKDETVKGLEFQIVCSRCDEQNSVIDFNDSGEIIGKTFYKTRFCPNCGAKMELRTPTEVELDIVDSVMMGGSDDGNSEKV